MYGIVLDRSGPRSLAAQMAQGLRSAIHGSRLMPGERLASSRDLAEALGVSRRLAAEVYDQLVSEGYLVSRQGSGTRVADLAFRGGAPAPGPLVPRPTVPGPVRFDFSPGIPDLKAFPRRAWIRACDDALARCGARDLSYASLAGDRDLRSALAAYLYRSRGLEIDPEALLITPGTAPALAALALMARRGLYCFEDPGPGFGRAAFREAGWPLHPVDVDPQGARPDRMPPLTPGSLVYLNPSHQYPTGALLPIDRRLAFVALARASDSYLIEDDYDSEFRLKGTPVPPLATLDPDRVIYLGSFSKTLAPFVRTAFVIVPPSLAPEFKRVWRELNLRGSAPVQKALAAWLESGFLETHIHRQRGEYRRRQDWLVEAIGRRWGSRVTIRGREMGSHLYLEFRPGDFSPAFEARCRDRGVRVGRAAPLYHGPGGPRGDLVLGYGNLATDRLAEGFALLADLIDQEGEGLAGATAR